MASIFGVRCGKRMAGIKIKDILLILYTDHCKTSIYEFWAMLKVLYLLPEYPPSFGGGIATFYKALLPALAHLGVEVTAIVGSGCAHGPDPSICDGVRIFPLDQGRVAKLRSLFLDLALTPDLVRHLAAAWAAWEQASGCEGVDVIECTDWGLFAVPGYSSAAAHHS